MENIKDFLQKYNAPPLVYEMIYLCCESPEHPIYHPEGTLDKHIDIVLMRTLERKENKELHFSALIHDICKHGYLSCIGINIREGSLKTIPEGVYWQNINHAYHAVSFINLPQITTWLDTHNVNIEKVIKIVENHMKMKSFIRGELGLPNGMRLSKRVLMKKRLEDVWEDLYYFSSYCDSMLTPSN